MIETSDEVDCEVDKERLSSSGDLKTNRDHLTRTAYTTVSRIMTQRTFFPNELRDVYVSSNFARMFSVTRAFSGGLARARLPVGKGRSHRTSRRR